MRKFITKYILSFFFNYKLEWYKSKFFQTRSACFVSFSYGFPGGDPNPPISWLLNFVKVADSYSYDTKVYYIGDLFYNHKLETTNDLKEFCNKTYFTKDSKSKVKSPSFYKMLKCFY